MVATPCGRAFVEPLDSVSRLFRIEYHTHNVARLLVMGQFIRVARQTWH